MLCLNPDLSQKKNEALLHFKIPIATAELKHKKTRGAF